MPSPLVGEGWVRGYDLSQYYYETVNKQARRVCLVMMVTGLSPEVRCWGPTRWDGVFFATFEQRGECEDEFE